MIFLKENMTLLIVLTVILFVYGYILNYYIKENINDDIDNLKNKVKKLQDIYKKEAYIKKMQHMQYVQKMQQMHEQRNRINETEKNNDAIKAELIDNEDDYDMNDIDSYIDPSKSNEQA